jgi:hypothetical protein
MATRKETLAPRAQAMYDDAEAAVALAWRRAVAASSGSPAEVAAMEDVAVERARLWEAQRRLAYVHSLPDRDVPDDDDDE